MVPPTVPPRPPVVYHDPDEVVWRDEVRHRFSSLVTGLTIAIVLAVIALGASAWALLQPDSDGGGGAARERIAALEQRVQQLEASAQRHPSRAEVASLAAQQKALADQVTTLKQSVNSPSSDLATLRTAVEAMQQTVQQLDGRMTALEQGDSAP
jgi:hypothetical protein